MHWADLHRLLYTSLQRDVVLWGHLFSSFRISDDKASVKIQTKVLQTNETVEIVGDLLVAADGCLSSVREAFLPDLKLRFVNSYYHASPTIEGTQNDTPYLTDIQATLHGEEFLIFQVMRIQKP